MVAHGVTRARLPADNPVVCTLAEPGVSALAVERGMTRSAAAMELWRDRLEGAVVAIGNAPTSLFRLLEMFDAGAPLPAAVIGMPVGFVGAAEFEGGAGRGWARALRDRARPQGRQRHGRRSRQRPGERRGMNTSPEQAFQGCPARGVLIGVGLGPGDPELVTVKAARLLGEATVVAYFAKRGRVSHARTIAERYLGKGCEEVALLYPVTTEVPFAAPEYARLLAEFYEESAARLRVSLEQGRDIALLCEGDPLLYGSFMHMFTRLGQNFRIEICAGVSGMSGCFAAARQPMTWGDDILTVLPATLDEDTLAKRLATTDAAVVMKLGGNFAKLRRALERAGLLSRALYVERGTMSGEKIMRFCEKRDDVAPYFSMALVPGEGRRP